MTKNWFFQLQKYFDERAQKFGASGDDFALNGYKAPNQLSYWTDLVKKRLLDDILSKLKLLPEQHVLDVGCGTGMILRYIAPHVAYITGVDISAQMLAIAHAHLPPNATLQQTNAAELPFKDGAFDRVFCYFVFPNFLHDTFTHRVIAQLIRVTRKGGFVFIGNTPDYDKKDEQAKLANEQSERKTKFSLNQFLRNKTIAHFGNIFFYRILHRTVEPTLSYRFYTRDFFKQFAEKAYCDIEFLPLNVEGFIYAPYRFDVRLWPK